MINKKIMRFPLLLAVAIALLAVGCSKDYGADIDDVNRKVTGLDSRVALLETQVKELDAAIKAGSVITSVTPSENGITVTLSNGESYTISNGKNGINGTPGSVITIGENGNWFIDGKDTGNPSRGEKGADGAKGGKGEKGADGAWYEPGVEGEEEGFWVKVSLDAEGKEVREITGLKWLPEGTLTAISKDGVVTFFNIVDAEGNVIEGGVTIGMVPITSLVIIPDVVAKEGGSLPIVDFGNILFENECGGVTSNEATLKFRVSPSNAATPAIEDLKFYFNTPRLRATEDKNLVEEITAVSLNKGVMMVTFTVNKARAVDGVTMDNQIQLAVSYHEEDVVDPIEVSSDWARVTFTDYALALGRTAHEALGETGLQLLPNTLAKAKLATTPAYPVFYDAETDLLKIARTLLADKTPLVEFMDNSKYGLNYVFDLLDENGKPIKFDEGDNKTNQQEYIVLNGSVVTAKVWTHTGNKVAIDKTPIVRVRLMNGNCVAAMAFIKLVFTEEEMPAVKPEVVLVSKDFGPLEASCEAEDFKLSVQEMNEWIYYPENLSYKDFHDKFDIRAKSGSEFANVRFIPDTDDGTETQPVTITIDPTTQAKNIGKTITVVAEIFEKDRPDYVHFELTFTLTITTETVYVYRFLNMWDTQDRGLINTEVPALENNNEISPNLNNLFRLDKPNINLTIRDKAGKAITDASYGYEYVFDQAKNNGRSINGIDGATFTLSVSADGKTLFAEDATKAKQVVATITDSTDPTVGDIFTYAKTEFAKSILNAGAENVNAFIAIKTTKCDGGTPTTIKSLNGNLTDGKFEVIVRRPVNMTAEAKDHFIDGLDKGEKGTFFNVGDIVELRDWRNRPFTQSTVSAEGVNYWTYYGIGIFTIDPTAIKYQSEKDGPLLPLQNTMIVEYDSTTGVLSWLNNGNAVTKPIYLNVPVVIPHKWGELHGTFVIEVRPTSEAIK